MSTRNAWSEKVLYASESAGQLSQQVYHHLMAVDDAIALEADPLFAGKIGQRYHWLHRQIMFASEGSDTNA